MARKGSDLRPLMLRLPEGLRRRIEREAERNGRSMNTEVIHRLEQSFVTTRVADLGIPPDIVMKTLKVLVNEMPDSNPFKSEMQKNLEESEKRLEDENK